MRISKDEATQRLFKSEFPRSNTYDSEFILKNQMGPNVLWLTEWLCNHLEIQEGMRILDLGCGKAMSSIFLAREYKTTIWAYDLWISASDNWSRICVHQLENQVFPIHGRATELPFADNFFDMIVSFDSYHYYGTDDLYLNYITRFLKPGGHIGIVIPGFMRDIGIQLPEHLTMKQSHGGVFWGEDCWSFHTKEWWYNHWQRSTLVDVIYSDILPEGWKMWRDWELVVTEAGLNPFPSDAEVLNADKGEYLGFIGLVARKSDSGQSVTFPES